MGMHQWSAEVAKQMWARALGEIDQSGRPLQASLGVSVLGGR